MTVVRYTSTAGRPFNARKAHGYTRTWCAWWTREPGYDPFVPPDAHGGAVTRDDVPRIVTEHAERFVERVELKYVTAGWASSWRRVQRGLPVGAERRLSEQPEPRTYTPEEAWRMAEEARRFRDEFFKQFADAFAHLRTGAPPKPDALAALGLTSNATEADVTRAFRRIALTAHPDRGGSNAAFIELTRNRDAALRRVRGEIETVVVRVE